MPWRIASQTSSPGAQQAIASGLGTALRLDGGGGADQLRLASLGRVPRPIAFASEDRFLAYSGATIG
jgi:hypothetical protein